VFRRQSLIRTRKQFRHNLNEDGQELVMYWWKLTEARFKTGQGDPSWLTGYMGMVNAIGAEALSNSNVPAVAYIVGNRVGYSLRFYVDQFAIPQPLDISTIDENHIATLAGLPRDDEADVLSFDGVTDADFELLMPVAELVSQTAGDGERFAAVVSVDPNFWNSVVAIATYEVQKNIQKQGLVRNGRDLDADTIEGLLRSGFVLRCLDEALGIEAAGDKAD
jgi:hypothetical protein